jgi:hypothetical protein
MGSNAAAPGSLRIGSAMQGTANPHDLAGNSTVAGRLARSRTTFTHHRHASARSCRPDQRGAGMAWIG